MRKATQKLMAAYIDSLVPILYIHHADFAAVDDVLRKEARDAKFFEFDNALGELSFKDKHPMQSPERRYSLSQFLHSKLDAGFDDEVFIVLKNVHGYLNDPDVIALLVRIAERAIERGDYRAKVVIISSKVVIPAELENFVTVIDVPPPDDEEIGDIVDEFAANERLDLKPEVRGTLIFSLKGLSAFQIRQVLSLAYQTNGKLDASDRTFVLNEKEQIIKKSGTLEMLNFKENMNDIGGLENLKAWLIRKERIFNALERAIRFGVDIPRGILILGMPGCGKSLAAKAAAALFKVPLIRLDIGRLMGKYVGESEGNMRRALNLAETVSPCVLWIDELEKAFAGIGGEGGEVATRMFGIFLTWMQEKQSTVFIVATANDISKLPPEFLRKGRFDELFFVDLPNSEERRKILEIHIKKRKKWNENIDIKQIADETKGFNGADLEGIVKDAVENAFIDGTGLITTESLVSAMRAAKSITDIQGDKINELRDNLKKYNIQPASVN